MRKFNRILQHLQPRRIVESVSELQPALQGYNYTTWKSSSLGGFQKPFLQRYIHATGRSCSAARDYYEVLGVSRNASRDDIKKSFHELAKKYHPDANRTNPSAKRKFQEIREAYETLGNSKKREEYDKMRFRSSDDMKFDGSDAERFRRAYQTEFSDSFHKVFSQIFEDETEQFASDIKVELVLTFSEAAEGCTKQLSFDAFVPCDSCEGSGHSLNAATRLCPTCGGAGRVTIPPFTATCHSCKGAGRIVKEHCMSCRGSGVVEATKEVNVVIPGGVDSGDTIRVPGAGNAGKRASQPGTLYIKLKVADDPVFSRDGSDIYVDADIKFTQAMMGGKVRVPTLSGNILLNIPKGVQPGQLLVLRGKGLPKEGFFVDHGDQYVRFRIKFPTEINERQRAILQEFAKEEIMNETKDFAEGSWWHRVLERLKGPKSMLDFSILLLLLVMLNKIIAS